MSTGLPNRTRRKSTSAVAHTSVQFTLDASGRIEGFTPNAARYFKTSSLVDKPFTRIIAKTDRKSELATFPPSKDEASDSNVQYRGKGGKIMKAEMFVYRMRSGKKTSGYIVWVVPADAVEDEFRLPEGYLSKKSSMTGKWQQRYFRARKVLHPDKPAEYVLDYYLDARTAKARGSISLESTKVELHFQPLVLVILKQGRLIYLKASSPTSRWEWAHQLNRLANYALEADENVIREEMNEAKKLHKDFSSHAERQDRLQKATIWGPAVDRFGGADGFQVSDLGRMALKYTNSGKPQPRRSIAFGSEAKTIPYFCLQVVSCRDLPVSASAHIMVKVSVKGAGYKESGMTTEIGFGPQPTFGPLEEELAKERKLFNMLSQVNTNTFVKMDSFFIHLKVIETGNFTDKLLGEYKVDFVLPESKMETKWYELRPLDKPRGSIKVSMYYESGGAKKVTNEKKSHRREPSDFGSPRSDFDADPFSDSALAKHNNKTISIPIKKEDNVLHIDNEFDEDPFKVKTPKAKKDMVSKAEVESLKKQLDEERASRAASDSKLAEIQKNRQESEKLLKNIKSECESAKSECEKIAYELVSAQEETKTATEEKKKAELALKAKNQEMLKRLGQAKRLYTRELSGRKAAEKKVAELLKKISDVGSAQAKEGEASIKILQEEMKEMEKKLKESEASKHAFEERYSNSEQKVSALTSDLKKANEVKEKLQSELKTANENIKGLSENVKDSEGKIKDLSDKLTDAENRVKELEGVIDGLKKKLEESKLSFGALETDLTSKLTILKQKDAAGVEQLKILGVAAKASDEKAKQADMRASSEAERANAAEEAAKASSARAEKAEALANTLTAKMAKLEEEIAILKAQAAADAKLAAEAAKANQAVPRALRVQLAMYARYLNTVLGSQKELIKRGLLPLSEEESQWAGKRGVVRLIGQDGHLVASYLNYAVPNTLDERAMHLESPLSTNERKENLELVANTCKSLGVPIGRAESLTQLLVESVSRPREIANFLFSLVSFHELRTVKLERCPKIADGVSEQEAELLAISPDALLSAWAPSKIVDYIKVAQDSKASPPGGLPSKTDMGFSQSWADLRIPALLVSASSHKAGSLISNYRNYKASELGQKFLVLPAGGGRLEALSEQLKLLGATRAAAFLIPSSYNMQYDKKEAADVKETWHHANLLFTAALFEATSELMAAGATEDENEGKSAEIRGTTVWLNNLGLEKVPRVHDLFAQLKDGLLLLKVLDFMAPKSVKWKKAELKPTLQIKKISNCHLAVETAKQQPFKFSLVGVGGRDINEGNKKLTLSLLWQMRRYQLLKFLQTVFAKQQKNLNSNEGESLSAPAPSRRRSSALRTFDENSIMKWANDIIAEAVQKNGGKAPEGSERLFSESKGKLETKQFKISSLRDESLSTSIYFLLLLWANASWSVKWKFVTPGKTAEQQLNNARYAITVARKQGASVFVLPEELTKVKADMVLVFLGALLAVRSKKL